MISRKKLSSKKIKIAFMVPGKIETLTGGYIYDKKVLEYLSKTGYYRVSIISTPVPKSALDILLNFGLFFKMLSGSFDIIIEDGMTYRQTFLFNVICRFLFKKLRIIGLVHMVDSPLSKDGFRKNMSSYIERKWLGSLDRIVVNSESTMSQVRFLEDNHSIRRIIVAKPGYELEWGLEPEEISIRTRDGRAQRVSILYVGQLIERKGLHSLLEALEGLKDLDWNLLAVGDTECDPSYTNYCIALIRKSGLSGRVKLVGTVPHRKMSNFYAASDIFVSTSTYEAFGMAVEEAQAFGIPAVAFSVGGVREIIRKDETGFLIRSGDITGLRHFLRLLVTSPSLRRKMSSQASVQARQIQGWTNTCAIIEQTIDHMLSENAA